MRSFQAPDIEAETWSVHVADRKKPEEVQNAQQRHEQPGCECEVEVPVSTSSSTTNLIIVAMLQANLARTC